MAGGWAADLHSGRQTRPHGDMDIAVLRSEHEALRTYLAGWDLQIAYGGRLRPWRNGAVGPPENAVWARPDVGGPWWLDIKIELNEGGEWVYRRHPRVRRPLESIGRTRHRRHPVPRSGDRLPLPEAPVVRRRAAAAPTAPPSRTRARAPR
ncbi:MAG: hypothetical protein H0T39_11430, partial [Actinobacteria bacterium]|nr:hypothetical protein [Actinomycetota bacterium]